MIYFDNCATTKVSENALKEFNRINENLYGNPNSLNLMGVWSENYVTDCKKTISSFLGVNYDELIFTSSATESNNMIIQGVAKFHKNKNPHFITQKSEHPSVTEVYRFLEKEGFDITFLPVNGLGQIDINELRNAIKKETILVSIMHINNETGAIFPIEEIGKTIKEVNKNTLFHVDGVQGFGKYKFSLKHSLIDFYSFSSHKIMGVKGVGGFYKGKNINITPLFYGGHQENSLRPSTVNVSGIGAFTIATKEAFSNLDENYKKVTIIKDKLIELCTDDNEIYLNGSVENFSPFILSLYVKDVRGEVLLHALELSKKIFVSTGTACNNGNNNVLSTYGYDKERLLGTIRIGISYENTVEEAQLLCEEILAQIKILRLVKPTNKKRKK
ncbi:MAG: cysteine desulfurase family protein [Lachnospirales bacterium]